MFAAVDAATWSAWGVWVTVLVYAVIGVLIWNQVKEAKQLRESELRPFVVVDFDVLSQRPIIYLTIANLGRTLARNVQLRFEPELSSSLEDEHQALSNVRLLTEGTPTLAPGKTIPIVFDTFLQRGDDRPDAYTVHLRYEGERGQRFEEEVVLDLGVYRNILYFTRHNIHDVHDQLKKIADTLQKWNSSWGGLKVLSPREERRKREDWYRRREELQAKAAEPAAKGSKEDDKAT